MFKWFTSPSTSTPFASCQNSPYLVDNLPLPPTTEESILIATDNSNSVTTTQENKDGGDITALNTLLEVFTASALPPTARTDPTVAQIQPLPMKFSRVWEYVPFLTSQGEFIYLSSPSLPFGSLSPVESSTASIMTSAGCYAEDGCGLPRNLLSPAISNPKYEMVSTVQYRASARQNGYSDYAWITNKITSQRFTGTALTKAFVNHHLYGPPKPSWGVELTLFTSFLREAAAYSHLSSIHRLRCVVISPCLHDGWQNN